MIANFEMNRFRLDLIIATAGFLTLRISSFVGFSIIANDYVFIYHIEPPTGISMIVNPLSLDIKFRKNWIIKSITG